MPLRHASDAVRLRFARPHLRGYRRPRRAMLPAPTPPLAHRRGPRPRRGIVWRTVAAWVAATGVLGVAPSVHASPTARLVYVRGAGAESCADEASMRQAVASRLGYDPFRVVADTTLTADVSRENGVFHGHVKLVDASGVERGARTLESRAGDCGELTSAMALSMSIAIDPVSVLSPTPATTPNAPEPEPPRAPEPEPPRAPEPPPRPPPAVVPPPRGERASPPVPAFRFGLVAEVHAAFGVGPSAAPGGEVGLEVTSPRFMAALRARFDAPMTASSSQGGTVQATLVAAEPRVCARFPLGSRGGPALSACGLVLLGAVFAESRDVSLPRSSSTAFAAAGLGASLDVPLAPSLSIRGTLDGLGHFTPYGLTVNGAEVFSSSPFSGRAAAGAVLFF